MAQAPSPQTQQEIIARFEHLREEAQSIASNLGDRRAESREHSLVVSTLEPLDANRKCYRQVGDVLIQRTVAEVLPDVKGNAEQLDQLVQHLEKQLEKKQKELQEFEKKYKIRTKGPESNDAPTSLPAPEGAQGVLVS